MPLNLSQKRILEILSKHKDTDSVSKLCDRLLASLILLNLLAIILESVPAIGTRFSTGFIIFELFTVFIFTAEYSLRIWVSAVDKNRPGKTPFTKRLNYLFSFTGIIDLLSILPSILFMFVALDLRWIRVLRLIRLLKFSHYSPALEDLISALNEEKNAFIAAVYLFLIALFFSSTLMYIAENEIQPGAFSSIPETMWWSLITLTTVGYGDVIPVTALGKVIGGVTALMGICVVALLTGIVATAYVNQISTRRQIITAEISHALEDGKITKQELNKIYRLKNELHLSDEYTETLMKLMSKQSKE